MLAIEAMDVMKFETVDSYSVGKMDIEYMSSFADELAMLEAFGFSVSLIVTGGCKFKYGGEIFQEEDELFGRVDVINALRNDDIKYVESPWFEVQSNDENGELIDSVVLEEKRLPTKLETNASLLRALNGLMGSGIANMSEEQLDLLELLPKFQSITIKLTSRVRLNSMQRKMTEFLTKNEYLFQVLATIEMETVVDDYDEMWFTLFCYCPNNDAMNEIRAEVLTYGEAW